jgi:hypothetical protein
MESRDYKNGSTYRQVKLKGSEESKKAEYKIKKR